MTNSRRLFLQQLAAASALAMPTYLGLRPSLASAGPVYLPAPDFSSANILGEIAGLRPMRTTGVRIESESVLNKTVIHNYGHGGSGFTLAWGSAEEAADLLVGSLGAGSSVAVLGAGVIGLTTARILIERGFKVKIYFADISPNTTSDVAGAQWSPSFVSPGTTVSEQTRYHRMLATTYRRYEKLAGPDYGVFLRPNYIPAGMHDGVQDVQAGIMQPTLHLARLPFAKPAVAGTMILSWLIEPSVFLPKMIGELKSAEVVFERRMFANLQQMQTLDESIIFNCIGLGARDLFQDKALIPIKGQLVLLKPKAGMEYLALHRGYTFCRRDAIVLGGSYEKNVFDTHTDPLVSKKILQINRDFFA